MRINLSKYPDAKKLYTVAFNRLDGGLNLWELDYRLDANQSSHMENLLWQDGVLQCRDGQEYIASDTTAGVGYASYTALFFGYAFFHIGAKIYCGNTSDATFTLAQVGSVSDVPANRGTFFRYQDWLFYKNAGGFYRIKNESTAGSAPVFSIETLDSLAYRAKTYKNASPGAAATGFGGGDEYQPENRLGFKGELTYNGVANVKDYYLPARTKSITDRTLTWNYDGTNTISIDKTSATGLTAVSTVTSYIGDTVSRTLVLTTDYTVNLTTGIVTLTAAGHQSDEDKYVVSYKAFDALIDSVDKVMVGTTVKTLGTDYTVDLYTAKVTFTTAPGAGTNNVTIDYTKVDEKAAAALNECKYASVSGGDQNLCIMLAGCSSQPNAIFWNANDDVSMNPAYWPTTNYNLVGDTEDPVTGFGKQYSDTIVLKEHAVGKLTYSIEQVNERDTISFTYQNINTKTGCDLPWSIQLIENNLVFCNTYQGVQILRSSSAALENNVDCISRNINGDSKTVGLLFDLSSAAADTVCSYDDDIRYGICVNGHVYLWDYILSAYSDPSWFFFTNVNAVSFFMDEHAGIYHIDSAGRVTRFTRNWLDYGGAINKVYQFPAQYFDSYDRLKDIEYVLFSVRSDTYSDTSVTYRTDYEQRTDATNLKNYSPWSLVPRNLRYRSLAGRSSGAFSATFKRRPGCRHIRNFGVTLSNNNAAQDLAIVSMQIFYNFQGRER